MASIKKQKAMEKRYKAEKSLERQREKSMKAQTRLEAQKLKSRKDARKARGKTFEKITQAYGYKPKLSQTLMGFANANNMPKQSAGRPAKVFKHTSPLSGKPVPAEVYYAHMRQFKNIQARRVEDAKEQQIRAYAKKGIPPSQIQQIQERIRQQKLLEQIQAQRQPQPQVQQNQYPTQQRQAEQLPEGTVVDRSTRVWKFRRGTVDTQVDIMGNRKQVLRGTPESFWN